MSANLLDAMPDLEALAAQAQPRQLRRGEILVRQGEPSDAFYFVLSGRFTVKFEGTAEAIAEIGQGEPIGEIGFFANLPRTATVLALRDSRVLAISRDQFKKISETSPGLRDAVIASLAVRLSVAIGPTAKDLPAIRTVAVVSAGNSCLSQRFVDLLREGSSTAGHAIFLTKAEVAGRLAAASFDDAASSNWLNALEGEARFVFYIADDTLTDWTKKCIRQADALLLVAQAGTAAALNPSESFAFTVHLRSARRLVILHDQRVKIASGTSSWLEHRDVFMHHHVALQDTADVQRLFRFLAGRAVGFVAGGGGALASAHLGVYKAFCEAGAEFDILGGTSSGAAMVAGLAYGAGPEWCDDETHNIFVRDRVFRRPTLPRYGLINHKAFDRVLQVGSGGVMIEDLWTPFFALSSNLSTHAPRIHQRGLVWQAVRASGSVPGVLPPFFTTEGEMLVDGALMDNIPLAPMKALKSGPNVVVALGAEHLTTYPVDYESIPGPWQLALAWLNPFSRRRLPPVPSILQVITLSMLANRRPDLALSNTDILIKPDLPPDFGFMSWDRHNEIFLHAYRATTAWIRRELAEQDSKVRAVIGAR